MKQSILFLLLTISFFSFSQNGELLSESENATVIEAQEAVTKAEEAYQKSQKAAEDARAKKIEADNEVENARMALRQAKLALIQANKTVSPIIEERYEVQMNPIYEEMSKGINHGISVYVPGSEVGGLTNILTKNIDSDFKSYMKNYKSDKVKKSKNQLFFDNILIPEISTTAIDLYTEFIEQESGVTMRAYLNLGTNFLNFNESSNAVANAENIFEHFARYMRQSNLEDQLGNQEKSLKDLQKDLEDYKKDIADAKEDISDAETEIFESREKITSTESQIDEINSVLERTRMKISKVQ